MLVIISSGEAVRVVAWSQHFSRPGRAGFCQPGSRYASQGLWRGLVEVHGKAACPVPRSLAPSGCSGSTFRSSIRVIRRSYGLRCERPRKAWRSCPRDGFVRRGAGRGARPRDVAGAGSRAHRRLAGCCWSWTPARSSESCLGSGSKLCWPVHISTVTCPPGCGRRRGTRCPGVRCRSFGWTRLQGVARVSRPAPHGKHPRGRRREPRPLPATA
jgi:hypothetical protein